MNEYNAREVDGGEERRYQTDNTHAATNGSTMPPMSLASRVQELQERVTNLSGESASNPSTSNTSKVKKPGFRSPSLMGDSVATLKFCIGASTTAVATKDRGT